MATEGLRANYYLINNDDPQPRPTPPKNTFSEAAASYIEMGGSARYMAPILAHFGERDVATIFPTEIKKFVMALYPNHKGSTMNRQGLTPARAIMLHAHELGWCPAVRFRAFKQAKSDMHDAVNGDWMTKFMGQCESDGLYRLSALVIFMQQTAARVSEACNLMAEDVNFREKIAILRKTKTDTNAKAYLTDDCLFRIQNLAAAPGSRVFGYKGRWSVNDRIEAVCKRAGIRYYSSHSVGRHTYASRAMKLGLSIPEAMDGGRWKSIGTFLGYVHMENSGRRVAARFDELRYANL